MPKRFTDTDKYKKAFIRGLPGAYKLLWDYLYHDCDHAGVWHKDFEIAQIYLGKDMPVNEQKALELFNQNEERIKVLEGGKKWLILPFIGFQYGKLNPENRAHISVLAVLSKAGIKGLARPLEGPMDKDKDMDKELVKEEGGVGETPSGPTIEDLMALWNQEAPSTLPRAVGLSPSRKTHAKARLSDHPDLEYWMRVISKIKGSKHLKGETYSRDGKKPWCCTFDWILNENNLVKIMDGNYDDSRR